MDFRVLAKVLGVLLFLVALAMGACLGYAFIKDWWGMESPAIKALEISAGITAGVGMLLYLYGRHSKKEILRREAIAIVGLAWIFAALFGSLPYMLCEPGLTFPMAFFESVSGFTTTGSTVIVDLDAFPDSILLWALTQWLGGIGIVVMFVAVLSFLGVGSRSLMQHESSVNISEGTRARISDMAATLLKVYVGLTVTCALGLWWLGMTPFEAVTHSFTTIATGGFSTHNVSIEYYQDLAIELWLALFMLLGGLSFMLYVFVASGNWKRLKKEEEAKYYFLILITTIICISLDLWLTGITESYVEALQKCFFTVISLSTSTGYANEDYDQWPVFSKWLLLILMLMGGCAGSTAGGLKMNRIILFMKITGQELVKSFRPKQVFSLKLNGQQMDSSVRAQTTFYLIFAAFIWLCGAVAFSLLEPTMDLQTSMGTVTGLAFNIGPGFGDVGPTDNYSGLHSTTLFLGSLLMILGRLEIFAVLVLFMPSLWRKY
ncbi:MAG: TrkH family potassium uptake protein [Verrucomicrobia bacterium]|nr:TrkH family potassium uptake protein [Verrucomicrobiota bacterium]